MDLLSRGFSAVLGSGQEGVKPDSDTAGVVEKLCQRLSTSTLIQDRRDAMRALRSLCQGEEVHRVEVGAQALPLIVTCLEENDPELCRLTLEAILGLVVSLERATELNLTFSEIVLKQSEVAGRIIEVSAGGDIHTQLAGIRLVRALSYNKKERLQECLLQSPGALSRLMDLLDTQEVIRNEVLLILLQISQTNPQIQKLLAFESGFDRLFGIIESEGFLRGGVITQDCLNICISLLHSNSSNQSLFREGPYIAPIRAILQDATSSDQSAVWDEGRTDNALLTLRLVRTLCSPDNPLSASQQARANFRRGGLLEPLFHLMLSGTVPEELLTETILSVAEVVWGQSGSQQLLAQNTIPSGGEYKSAVNTLLICMLNEKQSQRMRLACLYALQGHLVSNLTNQQDLLSTLLPSRSESSPAVPSSGRLLLAGLFGKDAVTCWCSSVLLVSALEGVEAREQLLRVQLSTGKGQGSLVSMICQRVRDQLLEPLKLSGLLCLLSVWVHNCPTDRPGVCLPIPGMMKQICVIKPGIAGSILLQDVEFTDHLIAQTEIQPDSELGAVLRSLSALQLGAILAASGVDVSEEKERVLSRLRIEPFRDMISHLLRSEPFICAAKSPQPVSVSPGAICLSFSFTEVSRQMVDRALSSISPSDHNHANSPPLDTSVMQQYKQIIANQDSELERLRVAVRQYQIQTEQLQNQLLGSERERMECRLEVDSLRSRVSQLESEVSSGIVHQVRSSPELEQSFDVSPSVRELTNRNEVLEKEQEELLMYLADLDTKVHRYKTRLEEAGHNVSSSGEDSEIEPESETPSQPLHTFQNGYDILLPLETGFHTSGVPGNASELFTPFQESHFHQPPENVSASQF